jgi:nucleotide-binding universal stress UspA family protein
MKPQKFLVAIDVSRDSLAAIQIAFDLAAAVRGQVFGLFVEDADLLAAVNLPFAREVGSHSGLSRPITAADVERQLHTVEVRARDALSQAGDRLNVQSSFRVGRGKVPAEILGASSEADIIVLGKAGWSIGEFRKPGSNCLAILAKSEIPVMVVEDGASFGPPILVAHDQSPAGARAVEFARELSRCLGWELSTLAVHGKSKGDEVLPSVGRARPSLIVLPASLPLGERSSELKNPIVFVP